MTGSFYRTGQLALVLLTIAAYASGNDLSALNYEAPK
jgi:hypothetical protein